MAYSSTLGVFTGTEVGPLVTTPLKAASVAFRVSTFVETDSAEFRIPKVTSDPSAEWLPENTEITASEATGDEIVVEPRKIAGLTFIANELAEDSSPEAAGIIGGGLANDIAKKIDSAFFGPFVAEPGAGYNASRPAGLESIPHASLQRITANPSTSVDAWIDAFYAAEAQGVTIDSWVTTPDVAKALAKLKSGTGSNAPLLADFVDGKRVMFGATVYASPNVQPGTVWGIPRQRSFVIMRKDTTIVTDKSFRLAHDQTTIRAVCRVTFAFPHTAGIVKIVA